MKLKQGLYLLLVLPLIQACHSSGTDGRSWLGKSGNSDEKLPVQEYVSWVNDPENGLIQSRKEEAVEVIVMYKPLPYVVLQEMKGEYGDSLYNAMSKEIKGQQFFHLRLMINDKKMMTQTGAEDYLMFGLQNDIWLIEGKDSLPCRLYHLERTYGVSPYSTIILGFDDPNAEKETQDKTLVLNDRFLGLGILKFRFDKEDIQQIPQIQFN